MIRFRMMCLPCSLVLLVSCASDYKALRPASSDTECVKKYVPFGVVTSWYDAGVDVVGKHLSGLLLVKKMPDSSHRVVFTNEAGFKFFDFEFTEDGAFRVHHVIPQLNRKAVVNLLRKDFYLLLGQPFGEAPAISTWIMNGERYHGTTENNETYYFITSADCSSLQRLESSSGRKKMFSLYLFGQNHRQPDSVTIQHHTFNMQINLRKLERN